MARPLLETRRILFEITDGYVTVDIIDEFFDQQFIKCKNDLIIDEYSYPIVNLLVNFDSNWQVKITEEFSDR